MQRKVCPGLGSRLAMDFAREKKREGRQRSAWSYLTYLVLYLVDGSVGEYGALWYGVRHETWGGGGEAGSPKWTLEGLPCARSHSVHTVVIFRACLVAKKDEQLPCSNSIKELEGTNFLPSDCLCGRQGAPDLICRMRP